MKNYDIKSKAFNDLSEVQESAMVTNATGVAPYKPVKAWSLLSARVPKWYVFVGGKRLELALSKPVCSWFFGGDLCYLGCGRLLVELYY
jgi:hypothetical protein